MNLLDTFAVLTPELSVKPVDRSPSLYQELDDRFDQFRNHVLVSAHQFSEDWGVWERHPAGDEIVVLLSGAIEFELMLPDGNETVRLEEPGAFCVVPQNVWHTARVSKTSSALFITPGEGTENESHPTAGDSP